MVEKKVQNTLFTMSLRGIHQIVLMISSIQLMKSTTGCLRLLSYHQVLLSFFVAKCMVMLMI